MKHSFKTTFARKDAGKVTIVKAVAGLTRLGNRYAGFIRIYMGDTEIEIAIEGGVAAREFTARLREAADRLETLELQDCPDI